MKEKMKLKNIASVIAGYTFRTAVEERADGAMFVLQAKNILDDLNITVSDLTRTPFEDYRTNAFVLSGDVVVSSRGGFRAAVFKSEQKNVIAASSVYILRLKTKTVLPDYLAIYLNSSVGQKLINRLATGAAINTILRKDLENVFIAAPSVEMQTKLVDLYHDSKRLEELLALKRSLISKIVEGVITI